MSRQALPQLIAGALRPPAGGEAAPIVVGSAAWFAWLADPANRAFSVPGAAGALTVRREQKGGGAYWYAYRRDGPRLRKAYLGKAAELSLARIEGAAAALGARAAPAVTQAAPAELRLLGAPELRRGAAPAALSSAKALALLGYLALAAGPQSREQLLDLLWPESAPAAARKNLRNTLWAIRSALGDDVLVGAGERVGLSAAVRLDLWDFLAALSQPDGGGPASLRAALGLYRGPLLDGLSLLDAPEFELWLTGARASLLQRYSAAAELLLAQQRAAGDWAALAASAAAALAHDDLHEAAHRALMEALARRGDRAGALRQYERLRSSLDRELGAAPDPASEAVHDGIVRGALTPAAPARPALPPPPRHAPPPRQPFVGRAHELGALAAEWALADQGHARVVVLSGELGIGKSRLWQAWAATLPDAAPIEIQCLEATQGLPFAPLIAVFSNAAWSARVAAAVGASLPPWLQELTRLLPALQELLPQSLIGGAPADQRQRLFEAFVQALLAVTAPPHLLFVDDLHWADGATLDWLDYAVHRLRDTPLLLVASYRSEDAGRDLLRRIAQWERDRPVRRLPLQRLSPVESDALLSSLGAGAGQQARLAQQSAGNPYFLTELAQAGALSVPPALSDLVLARVEALPEPARQVLQAAAVLEPDIEGATLVQISALDEEATLQALDSLLASGMFFEQDERYSFSHPLVATVVRGAMHRVRRATLHRRAATALAQVYAEHLPAQAGRVAAHYREAGDRPQAARHATMAGDYALSVTAVVEAVQFYRQALADEGSAERTLSLGRALAWHGDQDESRTLIERAYASFTAQNDQPKMALASLVLADLTLTHGGYAEAGRLAQRALDLIGDRGPFTAASAHILIGTAARARGDLAAAQQHIDTCITIAQQHGLTEVQMYAAIGLSNIRAEQGDLAGAFAAARAMVGLARQVGNGFYEVVAQNNAAYRATLLGDYGAAHAHIAAGLSLAEAHALEMPRQWLYSTRGELALAEGAWELATEWLGRARAEALRQNNHGQVAIIDANLGRAAAGRGELERAAKLLARGWQDSAATAAYHQHVQIGLWLAALYSRQGDHERARATWLAATAQGAGRASATLSAEAEQLRQQIERAAMV
jgi:DNA-binding SARP family transcriptional activator